MKVNQVIPILGPQVVAMKNLLDKCQVGLVLINTSKKRVFLDMAHFDTLSPRSCKKKTPHFCAKIIIENVMV